MVCRLKVSEASREHVRHHVGIIIISADTCATVRDLSWLMNYIQTLIPCMTDSNRALIYKLLNAATSSLSSVTLDPLKYSFIRLSEVVEV